VRDYIVDPAELNFSNIIADLEEIRKYNPQRFEMEQLTAVIHEDLDRHICAGFKDVTDHEFWVRGHMPGMPLMPGVMMCEAAAQLCSYFAVRHDLLGAPLVGFGGMEDVRFRDPVVPGDRLVIACAESRVRRGRMIICRFQGLVGSNIVVDGIIKGIPLPTDALKSESR
jgi:3-hydroxyacyl-[acyl-carrier-protein] dehydratase